MSRSTPLFCRVAAAAALLTTFHSEVGAQPSQRVGTIAGVVTVGQTSQPVESAHVSIDLIGGDVTDNRGSFVLSSVPAGEHLVRVSRLGFWSVRMPVKVAPGDTAVISVTLDERLLELPNVVVVRHTMTGGMARYRELPGSMTYFSSLELEKFGHTDVLRVLDAAPGVNIQEEDGYGLRPNIGIRGSGSERSSKITVMEDGILTAPAPYSAPAAYYFPTIGRMQAVELRSGATQIRYGPYTTGGALNLISTQPSDGLGVFARLSSGSDATRTGHVVVGTSTSRAAAQFEAFLDATDGFKELNGGGPTGYDKRDFVGKVRYTLHEDARSAHAVSAKVVRVLEESHETYLGLTRSDFAANPLTRYAASRNDLMDADYTQAVVRYAAAFERGVDWNTAVYASRFHRNWYKLDRFVQEDGTTIGIASLLADTDTYATELEILRGGSTSGERLDVKANNRTYYVRGIQSTVGLSGRVGPLTTDVEAGVRLHTDWMDRFQHVDGFAMDSGVLVPVQTGSPGSDSNRIERARAAAAFVQLRAGAGRVVATPGIRFEAVRLEREDYGADDPARTGSDLSTRSNTVTAVIPGLAVEYAVRPGVRTFVGVHRGFAPPGSTEGTRPESSTNLEAGVRVGNALRHFDTAFYTHWYSNLLGADLAAAGGSGSGDLFNGGSATVSGLEIVAAYDIGSHLNSGVSIPVEATWTLSRARFGSSFDSDFGAWESVQSGDEIPFVPGTTLNLSVGVETRATAIDLSARYVGDMKSAPASGDVDGDIPSHVVVDASVRHRLPGGVTLFGTVLNVADEIYIASTKPAGLRPGLPRTVKVGLRFHIRP